MFPFCCSIENKSCIYLLGKNHQSSLTVCMEVWLGVFGVLVSNAFLSTQCLECRAHGKFLGIKTEVLTVLNFTVNINNKKGTAGCVLALMIPIRHNQIFFGNWAPIRITIQWLTAVFFPLMLFCKPSSWYNRGPYNQHNVYNFTL